MSNWTYLCGCTMDSPGNKVDWDKYFKGRWGPPIHRGCTLYPGIISLHELPYRIDHDDKVYYMKCPICKLEPAQRNKKTHSITKKG